MKMSIVLLTILIFSLEVLAQNKITTAPWNTTSTTPQAAQKGQRVKRGYIVPRVTPSNEGAYLTVEIYQDRKNSGVELVLQAAINDGKITTVVPLMQLSPKIADNKNSYYSERVFKLDYKTLNENLRQLAPKAVNLEISPGTPLFVYALFASGHQWGGPDRGGVFYMPDDGAQRVQKKSIGYRTQELDLAFPINTTLANTFNIKDPRVGVLVGGQIRSRVEGEGKFQLLSEPEFNSALATMLDLANNPKAAKKVLGADWSLKLEDRYLKKDVNKRLILDKDNLPVPDPMVDTYYDNQAYDAAKNDMAIRYRWTAGNKVGAWNFKPGMGLTDKEGLVYRTEFAVDTTDDKPTTIESYADSLHPLNIFRSIRQVTNGALPSTFFEPSVKIEDKRYKFKLEHTNGLIIEVSLDHVLATSLRSNSPGVRFFQLEMDIDHLATKSTNVARFSRLGGLGVRNSDLYKVFLSRLDSKASFDGVPNMHSELDLLPSSPLRKAHAAEFQLAQKAIVKLRKATVGDKWYSGSQKYAVAAHALGILTRNESSKSVRQLLDQIDSVRNNYETSVMCKNLFAK